MDTALTVLYDFRDPASYLALAPIFDLIEELDITADWQVLLIDPPKAPQAPAADADRGAMHRWHRSRYREMDLIRYAKARGLAARHLEQGGWYRKSDGRVAAQAAAWLKDKRPERLRDFLETVFRGYWDEDLSLDEPGDLAVVLGGLDADASGFAAYLAGTGPAALHAQQKALAEQGYFGVPACILGAEVFYGRQHLPLIRRQLQAG